MSLKDFLDPDPTIIEYGNGIYRINCHRDNSKLGPALSKFKDTYPNIRIVSIAIDNLHDMYGTCIIITEPK